jgi:DNA-binding PadR family transcriptional regulator
MSDHRSIAESYLPLTNLSFHVLLALADGAQHGYAIGKQVEERSNGRLSPATGSLYQALRRLHDAGLIEEAEVPSEELGDTRRQFFRLTDLGRTVAAAEAQRLDELVAAARSKKLIAER